MYINSVGHVAKFWCMRIVLSSLWCILFCCFALGAPSGKHGVPRVEEVWGDTLSWQEGETHWVDSVLGTLSLRERVLQSLMVAAYSRGEQAGEAQVERWVKDGVGGVLFFQGSAEHQKELTKRYQEQAKVPLLVALDAEWGSAMRLPNRLAFPRAMGLGATGYPQLSYRVGEAIGRELRAMGVNVNFAPVADVNTHARNPIIGLRSFGDDAEAVSSHVLAMQWGLQKAGVMACVKHFPGHGGVGVDSHRGLPYVQSSRALLDSVDMAPFRVAIQSNVAMVMVGHLEVPALGCVRGEPASLSSKVVSGFLRDSLGYQGIVCTDALNMEGALVGGHSADSVAFLAYLAGSDLLLCPASVTGTVRLVLDAVERGMLSEQEVEVRCRRILRAKYQYAVARVADTLYGTPPVEAPLAIDSALVEEAAVASLTLLNGEQVPLGDVRKERIGYISLGVGADFATMLSHYVPYDEVKIGSSLNVREEARQAVGNHTLMIIAVRAMGHTPSSRYGVSSRHVEFAQACAQLCPTVLVLFGTPYVLPFFAPCDAFASILLSYGDGVFEQRSAAQALVGAKFITGTLPVNVLPHYARGAGELRTERLRLGYCSPGYVGAEAHWITVADSIAQRAIEKGATPGLQVLAAKDGEVFYHKNLGRYTYNQASPLVDDYTLYDVASLTKILATTPLLMHYVDKDKIDVEERLSQYVPSLRDKPVGSARIDDVLLHRAGLKVWYPFALSTVENYAQQGYCTSRSFTQAYPLAMGGGRYMGKHVGMSPLYYQDTVSEAFPVPVGRHLWGHRGLGDSIFSYIISTPLEKKGHYQYSDWGFMLLGHLLDTVGGADIPNDVTVTAGFPTMAWLCEHYFFAPLGMTRTFFNPWYRHMEAQCAPTEYDAIYRKGLVQGYVNDMITAMLGGVAGHAGLFSTANDVAIMGQMFLQGGTYGGVRVLSEEVIELFTRKNERKKGRARCLGFDRKAGDEKGKGSVSRSLVGRSLPANSIGHVGFTGTILWLDQASGFLFVLLSNRTFPDVNNTRLNSLCVRGEVMEALYRSVMD